jgi:radical SAM protein with 4Fe4S-binding SPASM domain
MDRDSMAPMAPERCRRCRPRRACRGGAQVRNQNASRNDYAPAALVAVERGFVTRT